MIEMECSYCNSGLNKVEPLGSAMPPDAIRSGIAANGTMDGQATESEMDEQIFGVSDPIGIKNAELGLDFNLQNDLWQYE